MIRRRIPALIGALAAAAAAAPPTVVAQQDAPMPSLDIVEAALDSGRVEVARAELDRWFGDNEDDVEREKLARARYLRGRMTADADSAEIDYIWVAIDGGGPYAAEAWLKLAQLRLMRGDAARAAGDLERLRADYPASPVLAESWLWSGFTLEAAGDLSGACEAWGHASELATTTGAASVRAQAELSLATCSPPDGQYTVQLGAFRESDPAVVLRQRVEATGLTARIESPDGSSGWYRVRSGHFASREQAEDVARGLTDRGFEAIVVTESP
jgi:tetratricopeptide (TPR) repeat protein